MDWREKICKYAFDEIIYYREKWKTIDKREWESIPIINKEEIQKNICAFIAPACLSQMNTKKILKGTTSGSTGRCLEVYWRLSDCRRSLLGLWLKRVRFYGIYPEDKYCTFYTSDRLGNEDLGFRLRANCLEFCKSNLNEKKLIEICKKIYEFNPKWLLLQPSIAMLLCQVIEKYGLEIWSDLSYIELTGEMLFPGMRAYIQKIFKCMIANQYGAMEVNSIAYESSDGKMYVMQDNVFVEILDGNGDPIEEDEGDICVTCFNNFTMPFIRYLVGDKGKLYKDYDETGKEKYILELTSGRSNDWILCEDGTKMSPYVLLRGIENVNTITDNAIIQFHIIQIDYLRFRIVLELDEEWDLKHIQQLFIQNIWQEELKLAQYEFLLMDSYTLNKKKGKRGWFSNKINNK